MLYNHEQMKTKFGTVFVVNVLKNGRIEEHFDLDYSPYEKYDTVEAAKQQAVTQAEKDLKKEEDRVGELLKDYENLPFLSKIRAFLFRSGYKASKVAKEVIEKKKSQTFEKIEIIKKTKAEMLDPKKTYEIDYPDVQLGDKIFLVVENANLVEAGFYEGKVVEVKNSIVNGNHVKFIGTFSIVYDDKEKHLSLNVNNEGKLHDGYSYHSLFLNEEQAKSFSNKVMKEKADFYSSKIQK